MFLHASYKDLGDNIILDLKYEVGVWPGFIMITTGTNGGLL
jgi:hypothetical protein